MTDEALLRQQVEYYRARAGEYDEWFLREGRYDRGAVHRAEWFREIERVRQALSASVARLSVLELACGTGLWTEQLARENRRVLAVDASPEVLAINRQRIRTDNVEYAAADLFAWTPPRRFDAVFFAFWLSHVPPERFASFWSSVDAALESDGRVFFVDSLPEPTSTATDHVLTDSGIVRRRLNDGREFDIVKVFYEPPALEAKLAALGWRGTVTSSGRFFLYASLVRA
jgi:demethylmenaquinone methyltransferase/2-methoxy-6-polyprenyl-1,4-benzoquinol methylase